VADFAGGVSEARGLAGGGVSSLRRRFSSRGILVISEQRG